jgi:hypothetical protein
MDPLEHASRCLGSLGLEGSEPLVIALALRDQRAHFFDGHDGYSVRRDEG